MSIVGERDHGNVGDSLGIDERLPHVAHRWLLPTRLHYGPQHLGVTMLERPGLLLIHP